MRARRQEETRMNIVTAQASDLVGIRWLLSSEDLPIEDLTEDSIKHFLVVRDGEGVVGAVGLELHGGVVLLRSLAVAGKHRKRGLGKALADAAESLANKLGTSAIYLLTTTAADFFAARGFRSVARAQVPAAIKATAEFASLCPSTAIVMVKP
jgi:amino-acid N-acetyltransferase